MDVLIKKLITSPRINNILTNNAIIIEIGRLMIVVRRAIKITSLTPKPEGVMITIKPITQLIAKIPVNVNNELNGNAMNERQKK